MRLRVPSFFTTHLDEGIARSATSPVRFAQVATSLLTRASRAFLRAGLARAKAPSSNDEPPMNSLETRFALKRRRKVRALLRRSANDALGGREGREGPYIMVGERARRPRGINRVQIAWRKAIYISRDRREIIWRRRIGGRSFGRVSRRTLL